MRRTLMALSAPLLLIGLAPGASAAGGQILDQAGDANGINGAWYSPAMLGYITEVARDTTFEGDPAGEGVASPGSMGSADIREVRLETEYKGVPVGDDGVDYRSTGLRISIRTEAPAAAPEGTGTLRLDTIAWMQGPATDPCRTGFHVSVDEQGNLGAPTWYRFEDCGDRAYGFTNPAWTAKREGAFVVLRFPFASLDARGRSYLADGGKLIGPHAGSQLRTMNMADVTVEGQDFVIGSDAPLDVPCTRGCPRR